MMMKSRENGKEIPNGCTSAIQNKQLNAKCNTKKSIPFIIQEKQLEAQINYEKLFIER